MTQETPVDVTQEDRDAASAYLSLLVPTMPNLAEKVAVNQTALARAFAKHRTASTSPTQADEIDPDAATGCADDFLPGSADQWREAISTQADAVSVERVAQAICQAIIEQDDPDINVVLSDDLTVSYLDQGEVDFGKVAKAALTAMNTSRDADFLRDAIVNAYIAGCEAVQNNYHPYNDPCFKEAAYDYASEALAEGD